MIVSDKKNRLIKAILMDNKNTIESFDFDEDYPSDMEQRIEWFTTDDQTDKESMAYHIGYKHGMNKAVQVLCHLNKKHLDSQLKSYEVKYEPRD